MRLRLGHSLHQPAQDLLRYLRLRGTRNSRGQVVRLVRGSVVFGRPHLRAADGQGAILQYQPQRNYEENPKRNFKKLCSVVRTL